MPRGMVSTLVRPKLEGFQITDELEEWFASRQPADPNRRNRERVVKIFQFCINESNKTPLDGLRGFYAGMRVRRNLAPSTCCTYVKYVIAALNLPRGDSRVREVLRVAARESARSDPVRPCLVAPRAELIAGVYNLPLGPDRRAATIMLATGARCADVAKLKQDEVFVDETADAGTLLEIAWSEQKARKTYGTRITIRYPSALIGGEVKTLLREVAGCTGPPCLGVTPATLNAALANAGVNATTRSFRVCFIDEAYAHLEREGYRPIHTLTGHKSDAIPSAVYGRHATRQRAKNQRAKKERGSGISRRVVSPPHEPLMASARWYQTGRVSGQRSPSPHRLSAVVSDAGDSSDGSDDLFAELLGLA